MRCGRFEDSAREYVITDPCTPTKWINYVGTLAFGGFIDHTGGALICRGDPATNRITRYISPATGERVPRHDPVTCACARPGGWKILSPFFVPGLGPLDSFGVTWGWDIRGSSRRWTGCAPTQHSLCPWTTPD